MPGLSNVKSRCTGKTAHAAVHEFDPDVDEEIEDTDEEDNTSDLESEHEHEGSTITDITELIAKLNRWQRFADPRS